MPISVPFRRRVLSKLQLLYGQNAEDILSRIDDLADRYQSLRGRDAPAAWDERSVILITYGDQVSRAGQAALDVQREFLLDHQLNDIFQTVHLLPFFPFSSDDGFSVMDYRRVNPAVGGWNDVERFGKSFGMAFDFVVNHVSQKHAWFQAYLRGEEPFTNYFIEESPSTDLSQVTRPRSTPLLTPFETNRGTRHVWTTFSADQIDLNYACPDVLLEALDILLLYILRGATVIRLDAIGFLWKRIGTTCMHLPETHAVVKLMRDVVDDLAPGTILLTETNVPHKENVSYFGDGDEAHAVYQFSLAPLLLDALLAGSAKHLNDWLAGLDYPGDRMTYFNFTASHDGIGVRPLEGLVSPSRIDEIVCEVRQRGGRINMRRRPDGTETPYELNITYVSALDLPGGVSSDVHARRFLTSQGIMLALRGIPGVYFHSLVGTQNYIEGVEATGQNRTINRRKFQDCELRETVSVPDSLQQKVFDGYRDMLSVRVAQPAFHPDAEQKIVETGDDSLIAFTRTSLDREQRIHVLANVSNEPKSVDLGAFGSVPPARDLLNSNRDVREGFQISPGDLAWLVSS